MSTRNFVTKLFHKNQFGWVEIGSRLLNWTTIPAVGLITDPSLFGELVLLSTAINILVTIACFGQQRTVLHFGANEASESDLAIFTAVAFAILLLPLCYLALAWFNGFLPGEIVAVSALTIFHQLLAAQKRAFGNRQEYCKLRVSLTFLRFSLVLSAIWLVGGVAAYVLAELLAIALSLSFSYRSFSNVLRIRSLPSPYQFKNAWKIGIPLLWQSTFLMLLMNYDKLLFARLGNFEDLGNYALLFLFASSLAFLLTFLAMRFEPAIYQSSSVKEARVITQQYAKALFAIQGVAGLLLIIIYQVAASAFPAVTNASEFVFPMLVMGHILNSATKPWSNLLTKLRAIYAPIISITLVAIVAVTLNSALIPKWGAEGAAFTFLVCNTVFLMALKFSTLLAAKAELQLKSKGSR
ncbi:hypothetical protein [Erythrobacter sp.]|uniref:lipopolysaccharide biosynthesis protein n=1 Tax=Erythrobacter sp. TaxID=1042 RepID=UPI001425BC76|nr:hypothetical protein [Erythrobacter sp.]QIQ87534.1 MAG: hypothetical protein G9473_13220 [Erythrobacter sp.]